MNIIAGKYRRSGMQSVAALLSISVGCVATPVLAQDGIEAFIAIMRGGEEARAVLVEVRFLNNGATPRIIALPDRIVADLDDRGKRRSILLERAAGTATDVTVASNGFARARYRLAEKEETVMDGATLSIPAWHTPQVAMGSPAIVPEAGPEMAQQTGVERVAGATPLPLQPSSQPSVQPSVQSSSLPAPPPADRKFGNAFADNLAVYAPIYAVYGPGTDSEARIQISFKYRLFGSRLRDDLPASWRDGLHFAYTQRMFWDLGAESYPFRNVDYQPELIYVAPSVTLDGRLSVSAQLGLRHESNGRDGAASRSINSLYVAPMVGIPLDHGYRLTVAPRLSLYVGDKSDNPDIVRYRGNGELFVEVGKDDGLRLSTSTRFDFRSGRGAISADLSYPLPRLLGGGPDVYLFGQSFMGYGENLLDYRRNVTRFRIGVALVR